MRPAIIVTVLTLLLTACGTPAATPTATTGTPLQLLGTAWTLTRLQGQPLLPDTTITLAIATNHLGGDASCNTYSGPVTATDAGDFHAGPLAVPKKFCAEPAGLMEQETAYLAALQQVTHYTITDDTLDLSDAAGTVLLTYIRQTEPVPNE